MIRTADRRAQAGPRASWHGSSKVCDRLLIRSHDGAAHRALSAASRRAGSRRLRISSEPGALNTLSPRGADITARPLLVRNKGYAPTPSRLAGNVSATASTVIADPDADLKAQSTLWLEWTDDSDAEGFTTLRSARRARASVYRGECSSASARAARGRAQVPLQCR